MIYWIGYYLVKILSFIFCPLKIYGRENVPAQGSLVLASNHQSNLDPLLIAISLRRKIHFMTKDSLFRNKILGFILRKGNAFPVRRDSADIRSLREAIRRVKNGGGLLIFPQGTRQLEPVLQGQQGIGFLVVKTQVPVIPVWVSDSEKVMPPGSKWLKRHAVSVTFGQPKYYSGQEYEEIVDRVMKDILVLRNSRS